VVAFEYLDVRGVVDTLGGQGSGPAAMPDDAHVTSRSLGRRFATGSNFTLGEKVLTWMR
jgi:hypothetical protein